MGVRRLVLGRCQVRCGIFRGLCKLLYLGRKAEPFGSVGLFRLILAPSDNMAGLFGIWRNWLEGMG